MKKTLVMAFSLLLISCGSSKKQTPIKVGVAANVQFAFVEIKQAFEKKTGYVIEPIIGSSGKLTSMIEKGAPYAVFFSANMNFPKILFKKKQAVSLPRVYARGKLVLWSRKHSLSSQFKENFNSQILKIAVPHPDKAPYGRAAVEALKKSGLFTSIQDKIIYTESVSQANHYIMSKAVDAGFTSFSTVKAPSIKGKGSFALAPAENYSPILQGVVMTAYGKKNNAELAQKLINYVLSTEGKAILKKYGYE